MGFRMDIGIDLGTASVLVYIKGKGIVINEPSVVAIDINTNKILEVGEEARKMLGRTPGNIVAIRPLRDGVISDFDITEKMLKYFIKKAVGNSIMKPRVIICVPSGVTEVEKRAVLEASMNAGAKKTYLIEEPVAAAIGAGLDITKPSGHMIIDMGGGTTDIAVISLGGIVVSRSIKVAGDKCDDAIVRYVRKKYNVMIGLRSAEELKMSIGAAFPADEEMYMEVRGRNLVTGLPVNLTISTSDMLEALEETITSIADAVHSVLEKTPPELAADISEKGIIMTGGGCLIKGMDKLLEKRTGLAVHIAEDAVSCVAKGTGQSLEHMDVLKDSLITDNIKTNYGSL
ncbi:rod shape-determining protein MreB [Sedimentibacter hydroxybenzoicus DSM 7310]|uniref:Cell shape-determining protein MreB n=1 Tax=Sedimentibacter hydroxybenzoicus DSM 7310 TaxID=1123245 RepID=A0A974BI09_SEDHY|nr:rod shape-determining protein MreB [Sedimentibacter hydroxybenzoicus]NYB73187.1 rod shape-determining protein MreB [Sedimentibacter hydroxybenzoicus DSM 7310]